MRMGRNGPNGNMPNKDAKSASRFKQHPEQVIEELSLVLMLAKEASSTEEFLRLKAIS
ncbi:hypothetical protein BRAS3843_1390019 [Bradyrhizobium sp. STM 3843]|nr:hypothetical protein BRAS3843_1390019 [Bradyrhizobium sp. STM 3843]